jgi:hypothetical protein
MPSVFATVRLSIASGTETSRFVPQAQSIKQIHAMDKADMILVFIKLNDPPYHQMLC